MTDAWPWLTYAGLGAFHGLNPAMGWLFAVALGLQRESRAIVLASLVPIAIGHAASIKILATLTPGGLAAFGKPDIPTFEKLGADFVPRMFYGYAVRAATPADRVEKLRAAFKQAVEDPEARAKMTRIDLTPTWIDPKTYEATLRKVAEDGVKLRAYLKK